MSLGTAETARRELDQDAGEGKPRLWSDARESAVGGVQEGTVAEDQRGLRKRGDRVQALVAAT